MRETEVFSFSTGKLRVFEVLFQGDNVDVFRPGEWVQGFVRIILRAPKKDIRGISLTFKGKAKTKWTEIEGTGDHKHNITYYLKEKYFQEKLIIAGKDKRHNFREVELEAGEHRFPFRFYIPAAPLPYAFEGRHGHIRYYIKAKIDRPWKFDHVTYRFFSIVGAGLDLNRMTTELAMPRTGEVEKTLCCLCCASGPIKVSAHLEKSGFVPGENIYVSATVDNRSSREILSFKAKLYQEVSFLALRSGTGQQHTKREKQMLIMLQTAGCGAFDTAVINREPLPIPSCPSSGLVGCNIIHIDYNLEIDVDVSGTPFDAKVFFPITIGILPLYSSYSLPSAPSMDRVVTEQPTASYPSELPPPTYEIAAGGLQEIPSKSGYDYTFGKLLYAPRYPFYNFEEDDLSPGSQQQYPEKMEFPFFPTDESSSSLHAPPPPPTSHKKRRGSPRRHGDHAAAASVQRMDSTPSPNQLEPPGGAPLIHPLADQVLPCYPEVEVIPPSRESSTHEGMSTYSPVESQAASGQETEFSTEIPEAIVIGSPSPPPTYDENQVTETSPLVQEPPDQSIEHNPSDMTITHNPPSDSLSGQDINIIMQNSVSSDNVPSDGTQNDTENVPMCEMEHDPPNGGAEAPSTTV